MSTDRVDIADLVAKLDAWQRECAMLRVEPKGITTRELTELRRIVVAAKEYVELDEASSSAADLVAAYDELEAAVRGEA